MTLQLPLSVEGLMPHQPPMRLINSVLSAENDASGTVEAIIAHDNIFLDQNGVLAKEALVELMAQAFAAVSGFNDLQSGRPGRTGYLVGVKQCIFSAQAQDKAKAGDRLRITVRPTGEFAGFVLVAGEVHCLDRVLAQGELKIWISPATESGPEASL